MRFLTRHCDRRSLSFAFIATLLLGSLVAITATQPQEASAAAGDGVAAYVSAPFVQGPPAAFRTSIETFDSWTSSPSFPASPVGTWSGNYPSIYSADLVSNVWGGATTTLDTPTVGGTPSKYAAGPDPGELVLTFTNPARYVGFWWSAGSPGNTVKFYTSASAVTPVATYTTNKINTILGPQNPNPYPGTAKVSSLDGSEYLKSYYFGRPANHTTLAPTAANTVSSMTNQQSHAFLNIYASGSIAFTKVAFSGGGFEFDNVAISSTLQTPPGSQVLIESVLGKTVEFKANGGTGNMPPQTSDTATTLTPIAFTRPGYTFTGWHTTQPGTGGTPYSEGQQYNFGADLTLYAQWSANTLAVTYDAQGGTTPSGGSTSTTTGATLSALATTTRPGYTFAGWYTATSGGTQITTSAAHGQTAGFTLYAQWSAITSKVKAELPQTGQNPTTLILSSLALLFAGMFLLKRRATS